MLQNVMGPLNALCGSYSNSCLVLGNKQTMDLVVTQEVILKRKVQRERDWG